MYAMVSQFVAFVVILYFRFDCAEGQSIEISSAYQSIGCVHADFATKAQFVSILQNSAGSAKNLSSSSKRPAKFSNASVKSWKFSSNSVEI